MNEHQIIVRPLITEKNTNLMAFGKYCFEVDRAANKSQIKQAVESIFNVKVTKVHIMNVRGKLRRPGRPDPIQTVRGIGYRLVATDV